MNIPVRIEPGEENSLFPIWVARHNWTIGLQRETRLMSRKSYARMLHRIEMVEAKLKATPRPFNTEGSDEEYENWKADKEMYTDEDNSSHLDPNS